ncbi:hypothetical protein C5S30_05750 [ANME-1 cluster archaeon GoMg4]|nr:hypothetical protein [ANME-1 cluster archaeon GoMg4]
MCIMKSKEIAILIVFLVFMLPLLIKCLSWAIISITNPSPENIEKGAELIAESAIPWWIGVIEWLASLPSIIAAVLIIVFIYFLKWMGK